MENSQQQPSPDSNTPQGNGSQNSNIPQDVLSEQNGRAAQPANSDAEPDTQEKIERSTLYRKEKLSAQNALSPKPDSMEDKTRYLSSTGFHGEDNEQDLNTEE